MVAVLIQQKFHLTAKTFYKLRNLGPIDNISDCINIVVLSSAMWISLNCGILQSVLDLLFCFVYSVLLLP